MRWLLGGFRNTPQSYEKIGNIHILTNKLTFDTKEQVCFIA
jgi:hypothetical protein